MILRLAALLLLALGSSTAEASGWSRLEEAIVREGDLLFNDPFSGGFGSRAVHFSGRLDEGTQYNLSVFRWQYGLLGGWGTSVVAGLPDGTVYVREQKIPEKSMQVAADRFDLSFGESRLWGEDGRYRVRLALPDFFCDLTVNNLLPLWQPGDGFVLRSSAPKAFLRYGVHSPWALTEGRMVVRGRALSGQGQGFGDRSRAAFPVSKITPALVAFDGFSEGQVPLEERWFLRILSYQTHEAFGGKPIPIVILAHGGRSVLATSVLHLAELDVRADAEGLPRPHGFRVQSSDSGGCLLEGEFTCERQFHSSDVFQKLPPTVKAVAAAFFRRPIIFRDLGIFRGTVRLPDGSLHRLELSGQSEYDRLR